MRFCQPHWDQLKVAIDARGLSHLIARDGKEAVDLIKREMDGEASVIEFDPLMAAHNMLWGLSMNVIGLDMMVAKEDGSQRCPVCELKSFDYVSAAAQGALMAAQDKGLVEKPL